MRTPSVLVTGRRGTPGNRQATREVVEDAADAPLVEPGPGCNLAYPETVPPQPDDLVVSRRAGPEDAFPELSALGLLTGPGLLRVRQASRRGVVQGLLPLHGQPVF